MKAVNKFLSQPLLKELSKRFSSSSSSKFSSATSSPSSSSSSSFIQSCSSRPYSHSHSHSHSNSNHSHSRSSNKKSNGKYLLAAPSFLVLTEILPPSDDNKENVYPSLNSPKTPISLHESSDCFSSTDRLEPVVFPDTRLSVGVALIPHPAKRDKGGEDAYFVSDDLKVLGVADGVGGWGDLGVDPAMYARMIMAGAKYIADSTANTPRDPQEIMNEAYNHSSEVQGSSTCCVLVLDGLFLLGANLGDSGFIVLRDGAVVFRSKEQQHSFNFPYQLGTGSSDRPSHASRTILSVQAGDLIIMGSDGLFDNLYDEDIVSIAGMSPEPATIAQLIARRAFIVANSKTHLSPFAKAARENGYPLAIGGKLDDITVMVGRVVLNDDRMID